MKIIVLHGDNVTAVYKRLETFKNEAKRRSWETRYIDMKSNIKEQVSITGLFEKNVLFILEDANRLSKSDIKWLNDNTDSIEGTLTLYSESILNKTFLNSFSNITKAEEYRLPVLIWKLLESIFPGNTRNCIKLFHEVIKEESPEFIFALISRHVRDLYWSNLENNNLPYPSWRISKLRSQARKFPDGKLKEIIKLLSEIDIKVKTGKDNIADSLDFLFATQLE